MWIRKISQEDASGLVKRYYDGLLKDRGFVPETISVFSIKENNLRATQSLRTTLMEVESGLSRTQKEMIAVRVSTLNECDY